MTVTKSEITLKLTGLLTTTATNIVGNQRITAEPTITTADPDILWTATATVTTDAATLLLDLAGGSLTVGTGTATIERIGGDGKDIQGTALEAAVNIQGLVITSSGPIELTRPASALVLPMAGTLLLAPGTIPAAWLAGDITITVPDATPAVTITITALGKAA